MSGRQSGEVLFEPGEDVAPGSEGLLLVVGRAGVVVEGMPRAGIGHELVCDASGSELRNAANGAPMPAFCCKLLDERGSSIVSVDLTAETLEAAIRNASELLRANNQPSSPRRVYSFEVWSGTSRLFPPPLSEAPTVT